jgi:hypothetical protein
MTFLIKHLKQIVILFSIFIVSEMFPQLNSVDVFGGANFFTNSIYQKSPSPSGTSFGLRYNHHLSWELNATAAFAMSNSQFYLASFHSTEKTTTELIDNSYLDFQFALQWQWLTEVRTRMAGGGNRQTCKGAKAIIFANFKSYLILGAEMRKLNSDSKYRSSSSVTNFFAGLGFDTYRFGRNAHHGSNAFVPFVEFYYANNFGTPYANDEAKKDLFLNHVNVRLGMKYTFGFKEKKFSW